MFVDLDGTTSSGGALGLKVALALRAGAYILRFDLGSNVHPPPNLNANESGVAATGDVTRYINQTLSVFDGNDFSTFSLSFSLIAADNVTLVFESLNSNDNFGAVIDNIEISKVPLPAGLWLAISALGTVFVTRAKRARRAVL